MSSPMLVPTHLMHSLRRSRFSRKLAVADLYKLPEVVSVREQGASRLVCLLPSSQLRQSPVGSSMSQEASSSASGSPVVFEELEYHEPVCRQHYSQSDFRLDSVHLLLKCMFLKCGHGIDQVSSVLSRPSYVVTETTDCLQLPE